MAQPPFPYQPSAVDDGAAALTGGGDSDARVGVIVGVGLAAAAALAIVAAFGAGTLQKGKRNTPEVLATPVPLSPTGVA